MATTSRWLALLAALVIAGCGGGSEPETTRELGAPPEQFEPDEPDAALASTIAVVDIEGEPAAEPDSLQIASDASIEGVEWDDWGSDTTAGEGDFRLLVCEPNCAEGETESVAARIELSEVVECEGQRYYSEAELTADDLRRSPAIFIDPPC